MPLSADKSPSSSADKDGPPRDEQRTLSRHILPSSGTMFGICTTLVGLVKVAEGKLGPSHVDEYAALVSLFFMASAIASYVSIRHEEGRPNFSARCERLADKCFLLGLMGVVAIGLLFAYEVI